MRPGKVLFLGFIVILIMLMWWWIADSNRAQQEALERSQYIESLQTGR